MAQKRYVADFETTTQEEDCRVWAYATSEIGNADNVRIGTSLDEFMAWCEVEYNPIIYFHNLKFDGEFIFYWLLTHGYTYSTEKLDRTFNNVISKEGQFYSLEVIFKVGNKRVRKVTFYDSLKKLPFTVEKIAKDFELPISKLKIDYKKFRPVGYQLTQEENDYIRNDVKIVALALETQIAHGLTKMTNGSDALTDFKNMIGKNEFKYNFPVLDLMTDEIIRSCYKGGYTYVAPRYQNKDIGRGIVFDVNSLYPSVMYYNELPYGQPVPFNGKYEQDDNYPLYMQVLRCRFKLKEGYLPTIQIKGFNRFVSTEYLTTSKGKDGSDDVITLSLTSVDLKLFFEHYDVEVDEWVNGYKFKSCKGIFNNYIDKWMYEKIHNKGAKKALAKLMLNSLYGKFATNPDVTGQHPVLKDGVVKYELNPQEYRDPVYTPMGCFITAWARYKTISTAQKCYDRFIYADTDSIHLEGTEIPDAIKDIVDPDKLGYWGHESTFDRARFLRQKTYIEEIDGKLNVKCAGMTDDIKKEVTWENFHFGFKRYEGKLRPKHVKGGIVLEDVKFEIKVK